MQSLDPQSAAKCVSGENGYSFFTSLSIMQWPFADPRPSIWHQMRDEMVSFLYFVLCDNVTCDIFYSSRTLDHHSCATYASRIRTSLRAVNRDKRSSFSNTSSVIAAKSSPATPCTLLECLAKREAKRRAKRSAKRSETRSEAIHKAKRSEKRSERRS